ncbi:MAG TPA: serine hydrolase domain-containing protein [Candidatus Eisenbacteria bacterium]|jgi:CubicO group peptidase (beta-lactamase class C family)
MSFLPPLPIPALVVTSLAVAGIVLPALALVVAATPYIVAAVVALFRRDPGGPFVPHRVALVSRSMAVGSLIVGVLAMVAVQPRYFRPGPAAVPAQAESGDPALRTSIALDLGARIDSLPCAGVVVGVVQPTGNQVFGFGRKSVHGDAPPDGETVFEIGGMTQVFTATLFARMVEKGIVRMDQPIQALVPDTVSVPTRQGHAIELWHLATWSSGLPRLAKNPASPIFDLFPPYSRVGPPRSTRWLYDLLSSLEIEHAPGTHVDDSDLGMGLLGHVLGRVSKTDYETLLQRELCGPLGLRDTRVRLTPPMQGRLAEGMRMGYGSYRGWYVASPAYRWPRGAIPGAGDLCSTANDLLTLLRAHLAGFPLASALAETRRPHLRVEGRPEIGLGWFIEGVPEGAPIVWQHGTSGACRSYMAFAEGRGAGVVVLANVPIDVDLLGKRILHRLISPSALQGDSTHVAQVPGDSS